MRRCWQSEDKETLERGEGNLPPPLFISKNPRIQESMIPSLTSCNVDGLLHRIVASKNREVHDRFPVASLILRSQAQCRASYLVHFLKHVDMFTQFLPVARHLRFEDIQTMVNLISDPRQILSLLIGGSLNNLLINSLFYLNNILQLPCNPLASPRSAIQSVDADTILRCNEATTLASNEVTFNRFPIYSQGFRHKPSLSGIVHKVNASLNQGFKESVHPVHQLSSSNIHPPYLSGRSRRGRGTSVRIGIVARNPKGQPLQKGKTK